MSAGRLAVTGIASFLGARLLRRLAVTEAATRSSPSTWRHRRPRSASATVRSTSPSPPRTSALLEAFREEEVETVVHTAFFTNPRRDATYAHELESIGTLNLLRGRGRGGRAARADALVHRRLRRVADRTRAS